MVPENLDWDLIKIAINNQGLMLAYFQLEAKAHHGLISEEEFMREISDNGYKYAPSIDNPITMPKFIEAIKICAALGVKVESYDDFASLFSFDIRDVERLTLEYLANKDSSVKIPFKQNDKPNS